MPREAWRHSRDLLTARLWRHRHFYLFISPFFLLFAVFGLYPLLFSLYLSFTRYDGMSPARAVGLENFATLLHDDAFYGSLWNTFVIGALHIPPMFAMAFLFAVILNAGVVRLQGLFRAVVFVPCIMPMVVIAIVFGLLYGHEAGLLNHLIGQGARLLTGAEGVKIRWVESESWSKISVSILLVWRWTGFNMVLMLAGLQGIPRECYEAATMDGATKQQQLWQITVPLMRPTFTVCAVMSLVGTVYMFDEVFVLTRGGPGTSSTNFGVFLFHQSFSAFRFGYASSAAYAVGVAVFIMSMLIYRWRSPTSG